jgi:FkbM family methyltransferase
MLLPYAATDLIQRHILRTGVFFETILLEKFRRHIPTNAIIIDAGANIGNHSVYFSKICHARSVYAFEPMRQTFKILARNAALNAPEKIICYNFALGSSNSKADLLQFYPGNIGTARVQSSADGLYEIKPLDAFHFPEVQVLKIAVEGAETDVLEGARQTLARCKPIIWVELLPNYAPKSNAFLRSLGYEQVEGLSPTDFIYRAKGS